MVPIPSYVLSAKEYACGNWEAGQDGGDKGKWKKRQTRPDSEVDS